jgi:hypothetical protein
VRGQGEVRERAREGGEMTQTLYAHMNKKKFQYLSHVIKLFFELILFTLIGVNYSFLFFTDKTL